jgi:hypothetical protein
VLSIITKSVTTYTSLFSYYPIKTPEEYEIVGTAVDINPHAPRFIVRLCLENAKVEFDPILADIGEAVVDCLDFCVKTVESLPRVDAVIYHPDADILLDPPVVTELQNQLDDISALISSIGADSSVRISPEPMVVRNALDTLRKYTAECFRVVHDFVINRYKKHEFMYSNRVVADIEQFFKEDHTFEEYTLVS